MGVGSRSGSQRCAGCEEQPRGRRECDSGSEVGHNGQPRLRSRTSTPLRPMAVPLTVRPHIVHNDPARVLTDLAAKQDRLKYLAHMVGGSWVDAAEHAQAEHLLRLEASAYDWHEDYRTEWRL
ncbi:DUF6221 family protein [Microtetraspora malaysiensis]|uniref:DUF6221 family protein n=1 Tax=Microtetraspora malaysiensis TaxID=161358 RepID=UPI003D93E074